MLAHLKDTLNLSTYRMCAIIFLTHVSLRFCNQEPFNITDNLCTKQRNSSIKSEVYNRKQVIMAHVHCTVFQLVFDKVKG